MVNGAESTSFESVVRKQPVMRLEDRLRLQDQVLVANLARDEIISPLTPGSVPSTRAISHAISDDATVSSRFAAAPADFFIFDTMSPPSPTAAPKSSMAESLPSPTAAVPLKRLRVSLKRLHSKQSPADVLLMEVVDPVVPPAAVASRFSTRSSNSEAAPALLPLATSEDDFTKKVDRLVRNVSIFKNGNINDALAGVLSCFCTCMTELVQMRRKYASLVRGNASE